MSVTATPTSGLASFNIGYAHVTPNLWNIDASSMGYAQVEYLPQEGCLQFNIGFSRLKIRHNVGVAAYSEVIYGYKPWGVLTRLNPLFKFPMRVSEMGRIHSITDYRVLSYSPNDSIFNIAYDLWLTDAPNLVTGPRPGDVEVMVWLYHHRQRPAGSYVKDIVMPLSINGSSTLGNFEVWVAGSGIEIGSWAVVTFRLKDPPSSSLVDIDLYEYITSAFRILEEVNPGRWHIGLLANKFLNGVEFGSEFGNVTSGNIDLHWRLCRLSLVKT